MENKILAQSLLEWTRDSETTFIKAEDNIELMERAKKLDIVLPSPDLAIFKTIYAEIDKVNRNNVILPRKAVERGLPTLRGKQINWEHEGAGRICGYILDADIESDRIVVYGTLFKSLFIDEFEKVEELFANKKLFVSFEIWNKDEKGESVVHALPDGNRSLDPIIFHGCGLLLENPPACPNAKVLKLLASQKVIDEAEQIVKKVFEKDNRLVYAELAIGEPQSEKSKNIKEKEGKSEIMADDIKLLELEEEFIATLENDYEDGDIEEAKRLTYQERQKLPDSSFAVVVTVKNKKTGEPRKIRMFPIHDEAHVRNALARLNQEKVKATLKQLGISIESVEKKILKRAKTLNMTELLKRHEKAEDVKPTEEPEKKEEEVKEEAQKEVKEEPKTEEVKEEAETKVEKTKEEKPEEIKKEESEEATETPETKSEEVTEEKKSEETSEKADTTPEEVKEKTEEATPEENKSEAKEETKAEELKVETKAEEKKEDASKVITEKKVTQVDEMKDKKETVTTEVKEKVTMIDDKGKETNKREAEQITKVTYTHAEVEEIKATNAKTIEAKDKEIEKIKSELDTLRQEIEKMKIEKAEVEEKKDKDLTVGSVTEKGVDKYQSIRKGIDDKAFPKR